MIQEKHYAQSTVAFCEKYYLTPHLVHGEDLEGRRRLVPPECPLHRVLRLGQHRPHLVPVEDDVPGEAAGDDLPHGVNGRSDAGAAKVGRQDAAVGRGDQKAEQHPATDHAPVSDKNKYRPF